MTQSGFKVKQSVTDVLSEMYLCSATKLHATELSSSKLITVNDVVGCKGTTKTSYK